MKEEGNPNVLFSLLLQTFEKQGLRPPYVRQRLRRLVSAILDKKKGSLLVARDIEGCAHAAALVVWDGQVAYYLVQGSAPEHLTQGAASLLIWQAIQCCSVRGVKRFDFTGSMMPGVGLFLRSFGAELVPHHYISKENNMLFYWLMRGKNYVDERRRSRESMTQV